jgi:peptidoglycan/xylan/chitin deacetylase (PgdA/CDA1 family)
MKRFLTYAVFCLAMPYAALAAKPGDTRVERWKDGKTAAFMLMFDDSWPSHWQVAAPELVKRKMTATFYICPGKGEYLKFADKWEKELWAQGMVYGVHTMTHQGVKDVENAEYEIGENARIIRRIVPGTAEGLLSYAQPGVGKGKWNITPEEKDEMLKKHRLIERPALEGKMTVFHVKTVEEMLTLADKAIAAQGSDILVIHGVERLGPEVKWQDFWALKQDIFLPVLDGLQKRRDEGKLWIADHISVHQYQTERDSAAVKVLEVSDTRIALELSCQADLKLYRHPLTLTTQVPSTWKRCSVTQDLRTTTHEVTNGAVRFDASPSRTLITLNPVAP